MMAFGDSHKSQENRQFEPDVSMMAFGDSEASKKSRQFDDADLSMMAFGVMSNFEDLLSHTLWMPMALEVYLTPFATLRVKELNSGCGYVFMKLQQARDTRMISVARSETESGALRQPKQIRRAERKREGSARGPSGKKQYELFAIVGIRKLAIVDL